MWMRVVTEDVQYATGLTYLWLYGGIVASGWTFAKRVSVVWFTCVWTVWI